MNLNKRQQVITIKQNNSYEIKHNELPLNKSKYSKLVMLEKAKPLP